MSAKHSANFKYGAGRQHGAVLMIMLVIMIVGIAAILVNSLTASKVNSARQATTSAALAQAKDALIGFAITYGDTHSGFMPGYLPCPDMNGSNGEGSSPLGSCGIHDVSVIGRLPWRTLGLSTLRDGDGECLWYAVSGTYKDNTKTTGLMNWDTNGQFQTYGSDGTLLSNEVIAVVFAPGPPQSGQDRSGTAAPVCGGKYTVASYLDNNNSAIATGIFTQGTRGGSVNDQMIFITRQDLWNAIQKRTDFQNSLNLMTQRVAECLANYGNYNNVSSNNSLPWPAPLVLSDYSNTAQYQDLSGLYAGRVPYGVFASRTASGNIYSTLMSNAYCPAGWASASINPWWKNWKDHLFYAVGKEFRPSFNTGQDCHWFNPCLSINGSGNYAAVVMLAGPRLSSQDRTVKSAVNQYLEGSNASNYPDTTSGNKDYTTAPASSTFNDVLYCIKEDLSVIPCP